MTTSSCRTCGAAIVWAQNPKTGRTMPVDVAPVENGNIELAGDHAVARVLTAEAIHVARMNGRPLHISHFATCRDAALHRRRPAAAEAQSS